MGQKFDKHHRRFEGFKELLLAHPNGLTKSQIARRLDIHRSTAGDYIDDFALPNGALPIIEITPNRFTIDRDLYEVEVSLTQHECLSVHLAARLLTTRTDKHYPHAASALRKLSRAIGELSPPVSEHLQLSASVLDGEKRRQDPIFLQALETLTRAWTLGRKVELSYEKANRQISTHIFAPYFIEPYAVGHSIHVIGYSDSANGLRTLKVERILTIRQTEEGYEVPADYDPTEQLQDAWGIWYSDEQKTENVVLIFTPKVAHRVQETQWHHLETIKELPNGSIEWQAPIAEWREMLNWIRGWGADCEVKLPQKLRKQIADESCQIARIYSG